MKRNLAKHIIAGIAAALIVSAAPALEVNEPEIRSVGADGVQFVNYSGPHSVINTAAEIVNIGRDLGRGITQENMQRQSQSGTRSKYYVIHAVDGGTDGKMDADIIVIGPDAGVDHVTNLRRIIAGYLSQAYGYSDRDAMTIATFVTVYNAVYRGNMDIFNARYKEIVTRNLTKEASGLATNYRDWPGRTQIVIPLSDVSSGNLNTVDTSVISDSNVIGSMREDEDKGIDARKDMVDIKERQADDADNKAQAAQQAAQQEQEKLSQQKAAEKAAQDAAEKAAEDAAKARTEAAKAAAEAQKQQQDAAKAQADAEKQRQDAAKAQADAEKAKADAAKAQADAEKAQQAAQANKENQQAQADAEKAAADAKKAQEDAAKAQADADKAKADAQNAQQSAKDAQQSAKDAQESANTAQKDADTAKQNAEGESQKTAAQQQKTDTAAEQAAAKQAEADQKRAEAQADRTEIAKDQQEVIRNREAEANAKTIYGLRLTNQEELLSAIVKLNVETGAIIRESPVKVIRNRIIQATPNGYIAVAGQNEGNGAIKLVLIDNEKMEIVRESNETLSEESTYIKDGNEYYCIINEYGRCYVAKYSENITLLLKSPVEVDPTTPLVVTPLGVCVTDVSGVIRILKLQDLTLLETK